MEFQAVILCGPGHRLHPITEGVPKALLTVGNRPLVQYAVEWCNKAGFSNTIIAVADSDFDAVEATCHTFELNASLFRVPEGTPSGQVLRLLESSHLLAPRRDLVVFPCDFITELDPESFISAVRSQDENAVITGFYYRNTMENVDLKALTPDVLLYSEGQSAELLLDSYEQQSVKDGKLLKVRMAMLWRFPQVVATTDLLQSSIFFVRKDVFEMEDIDFAKPITKLVRDVARRAWRHRTPYGAVVMQRVPTDRGFFIRANNLQTYTEANRHFLKMKARQSQQQQDDVKRERVPGQAVIGNDSLIGYNTTVGERSSVKRTSIGSNCQIGKKCRLTGCVLLDDVTIANDVTLENCTIGKAATIETKSRLVGCTVEGGYTVLTETEGRNEVLKSASMGDLDEDLGDIYESISDESSSTDDNNAESNASEMEFGDEEDDDGDDFFDRS